MNISELDDFAFKYPTYILVAGGIGVGKSHVLSKYISKIPIVDIDNEIAKLALSYTHENLLIARKSINKKIDFLKANHESFVAMGTAADTAFTINRLLWARDDNFHTVLLHITCPVEQAISQNEQRRNQGRRAVPIEDEYLITRTATESAVTVSIVSPTDLVDHYIHYDNTRI